METPTQTPEQSPTTPDTRLASIERQLFDVNNKLTLVLVETQKAARARQITFWLTILFFLAPLIGIVLMLPTLMGQINAVSGI